MIKGLWLRECLEFVQISLAIFLGLIASATMADDQKCAHVQYSAPSGTQNDIVFHFDKSYSCGQYANGDWWVSVDPTGVVTLTGVDPVAGDGYSGLEINPTSKNKQGFDKRVYGYESSLNIRTPTHIKGGSSIVKTVSVAENKDKCRPCLQFAAILTVLKSPIEKSRELLRPPYFGTQKSSYALPIDLAQRLPRRPVACCSEAKSGDFERIMKRYRNVQLDHLENWMGGPMHPADNMPNYGADIATDNAVSVLRFLLSDFDVNQQAHRMSLINYLQMGVDLSGMATAGVKWPANGGHGNGRKLPILFAAHLLGIDDIRFAAKRAVFSEDEQVYFSEKAGKVLYGAPCSDDQYWMLLRFGRGASDCRDPYGYIDGGGHEIGESYQFCCTSMPWKYTALAVRMLALEKAWAYDPLLEYVDRWVSEGAWARPDLCAAYNGNPNDYKKSYGPSRNKDCIRGSGRYVNKHGVNRDGGHYRNKLGDQMWHLYRKYIGQDSKQLDQIGG